MSDMQVNPTLRSEGATNTVKMGIEIVEGALGKSILADYSDV